MAELFAWLLIVAPVVIFCGIAWVALEPWLGPIPLIGAVLFAGIMAIVIGGPILLLMLIALGFFSAMIIGAGQS